MTSTPPEAPSGPSHDAGQGPRVTRDEVRDLGRLRRSVTDRKVAGVCGGLARHLDIDPVILRVTFVVLVFFGGAGLILYGAMWLLVPEEGQDRAAVSLDERSRSVALIVVGVLAALALLGDSLGRFWFPWPLALIALVVLLIVTRRDSSRQPTPPYAGPYAGPVAPGGPAAQGGPVAQGGQAAPQGPTYPQPPAEPFVIGLSGGTWRGETPPPAYPPTAWAPTPPRSPRKRGPILFWFTLALITLAEGVLGIVDLAGAPVAAAAYPALAVGITGLMLLVGAFYGRAGGLILVGLLATAVLTGTTVAGEWDGTNVRETPRTAQDVRPEYRMSTGELVVDLTRVRNLAALDGRTIHVDGDVGRISVIVPEGLDATVHADVDGPGNISLFGDESGGIDISKTREAITVAHAPEITIDAELSVGQIEVQQS
jgi:phage shock protein PspC (stress-responsive transcriptional regulator)